MFFLKKLISYFILPPGIYVLAFLAFALLSKGKFLRKFALLCALSLYLISITPTKDFLYLPLENKLKCYSGNVSAVLVLGGGVYENGYLKGDSLKRLLKGFYEAKRRAVPLILSGGSATGILPEVKVMLKVLQKLGFPRERLILEGESRDTWENARKTKKIIEREGFKRVLLVTSAYHMRRALMTFKALGLKVFPCPTDFKYEGNYTLYDLFPNHGNFYDSVKAIREYLGLLYYHLLLKEKGL